MYIFDKCDLDYLSMEAIAIADNIMALMEDKNISIKTANEILKYVYLVLQERCKVKYSVSR